MRLDEFSNMASGSSGLSDTERVRFCCFGFDIASTAAAIASGLAKLLFGVKTPNITFSGKVPDLEFSGAAPDVTFVGKVEE
jgi:hypothetical protein